MFFLCPNCKQALTQQGNAFVCPAGHSYDRAKEGYVHLLPVQKMHAKIPGDNKQMVSARRAFLEGGGYGLFRDKLCALVVEAVKPLSAPVILDAGCGEGYYLRGIEEALLQEGKSPVLMGFDISKFAVKAAAKRQKNGQFAVASIFEIPVLDRSVDCLVNVFAPMVEQEFARVIRPGGVMIFAVPGVRHLYGLKEILYEHPYENERKETAYAGFTFQERVSVTGELHLTEPSQIQNLFAMTPYYWKTPVQGSKALSQTDTLNTEIAFDFLLYRRDP
ncbi:MAG: methyltransferase domain-containing protein [Oscillospiraceae bacterium]|nr:methyltransferase domain-containing protein [Oscillospiraceae bacterium]